ncbi:MAG: hypothetical protein R3C05_31255, partial [Pirellulaceae bacterium]
QAIDPVLVAFADDCRQAIAVAGGININSRVKMKQRAEELHLTEAQFEQGLALVRTQRQPDPVSLLREAFATALVATMQNVQQLRPNEVDALHQQGVLRFGVPEELAGRTIEQVAKRLSVEILTLDDARVRLREMTADALRDSTRLNEATRNDLITHGHVTLGLSKHEASECVKSTELEVQASEVATRRTDRWLVVTLAVLSILAVLGVGFALKVSSDNRQQALRNAAEVEAVEAARAAAEANRPYYPEGWNADFILAIEHLKQTTPASVDPIDQLATLASLRRMEAIGSLVAQYDAMLDALQQPNQANGTASLALPNLQAMETVLIQSYLVEDEPRVRESWHESVLGPIDNLKASDRSSREDFAQLRRRFELPLAILETSGIDGERKKQLVEYLNGLIPDDGFGDATTSDAWRRRLIRHLRNVLIASDAGDIDLDVRNFRTIELAAKSLLSETEYAPFVDDMLLKRVQKLQQSLGGYESLLKRFMRAADGVRLSQVIDTMMRMRAGPAQSELASMLMTLAQIELPADASPANIAREVRKSLVPESVDASAERMVTWRRDQQGNASRKPCSRIAGTTSSNSSPNSHCLRLSERRSSMTHTNRRVQLQGSSKSWIR